MQPFSSLKCSPLAPLRSHLSSHPFFSFLSLLSHVMATTTTTNPNTTTNPSPQVANTCMDTNTTFVHADPSTFRALVQKLTGAPENALPEKLPLAPLPARPRRPKLQERRRPPAKLEIPLAPTRPQYYHHHQYHLLHSPVSPMDAFFWVSSSSSTSSLSSSPSSSSCCCSPKAAAVVISKEEEKREEKAIASKGFYLHSSPRSSDGEKKPKLLPLFPLHSPRSSLAS